MSQINRAIDARAQEIVEGRADKRRGITLSKRPLPEIKRRDLRPPPKSTQKSVFKRALGLLRDNDWRASPLCD